MDVTALHAQLRELVDATVDALGLDGLELVVDHVRETQCDGPLEGAAGEYSFVGPLPDAADPLAVVTLAAEHWDATGIPHDEVGQDDNGTFVFATVQAPNASGDFALGVEVSTNSKQVSVGGSTPCVPGAVAE